MQDRYCLCNTHPTQRNTATVLLPYDSTRAKAAQRPLQVHQYKQNSSKLALPSHAPVHRSTPGPPPLCPCTPTAPPALHPYPCPYHHACPPVQDPTARTATRPPPPQPYTQVKSFHRKKHTRTHANPHHCSPAAASPRQTHAFCKVPVKAPERHARMWLIRQ